MQLKQKQVLTHKLILTQSLRQGLQCLQCSVHELNDFVQEAALSNPLLEVKPVDFYNALPIEALSTFPEYESEFHDIHFSRPGEFTNIDLSIESFAASKQTLREHLSEQLGQMRLVDDEMRKVCGYLIGCLDSRGYLDCPLPELAKEIGCTVSELEQALYVVQMLEPVGVGARDLSECLILQLAQSKHFNRLTLSIVQDGLDFLARKDYSALARMLKVSVEQARQASDIVLSLNPIPSRGFYCGESSAYISPDILVYREGSRLALSLNDQILPQISINTEYALLAEQSEENETKQYAKEKLAEATALIRNVNLRSDTLVRLMNYLLKEQAAFFFGGELRPVTMQQAADMLDLNVSTISRAVQNKYLQFEQRIYPLRDFFSVAVHTASSIEISAQTIRKRISYLVSHEDKTVPLSDEKLRETLEKEGISISRRAVAGHRNALNIPFASRRKVC